MLYRHPSCGGALRISLTMAFHGPPTAPAPAVVHTVFTLASAIKRPDPLVASKRCNNVVIRGNTVSTTVLLSPSNAASRTRGPPTCVSVNTSTIQEYSVGKGEQTPVLECLSSRLWISSSAVYAACCARFCIRVTSTSIKSNSELQRNVVCCVARNVLESFGGS